MNAPTTLEALRAAVRAHLDAYDAVRAHLDAGDPYDLCEWAREHQELVERSVSTRETLRALAKEGAR